MPVIDAHHHFWRIAERPSLPPGFGPKLARDFEPDDYVAELEAAGIDGSILVQSLNSLDETRAYLDAADAHPFVRGVVGWLPLTGPSACVRALEEFRVRPKFVGMRHLMAYEPDAKWVLQPEVIESLQMLAQAELVFEALPINPAQMDSVLALIERLPALKININHLGAPPVPARGWEPWASQMARAAQQRNVSVKLSVGGDLASKWQWSSDDLRRYVDHVLTVFGADRVIAASNWPVCLLAGSFAQVWDGLKGLLAALSPAEQRAVLGGNATRIFGLRGSASSA